MVQKIRYLSHPQVRVDPARHITDWSLSNLGRRRVNLLANSGALDGTGTVVSSTETKAIETARPLAEALDCHLEIRDRMHENDRSSTGFLPSEEFEAVADRFFAVPETSVRGWETAVAAQARIVAEILACLEQYRDDDVLFVGHGAVGTLLHCHLSGRPIDRKYDQGPGGGYFFEFTSLQHRPTTGWRPMEDMAAGQIPGGAPATSQRSAT